MNASFPLDLLDALATRNDAGKVELTVPQAERLRYFLLNMNKLDGLLKAVDLNQLTEPAANELRTFLRREEQP